jgi:uncharacterized protein (TIGR00369 family)
MPLAHLLGIEILDQGPDEVRGRMPWRAELCTAGGVLHGGAIMALADSTGALCAFHHLPAGAGTTTIESKTNFLRAVRAGHVEAVSRPVHAGGTIVVVSTDVLDPGGKLVARTTQTQLVLNGRNLS